MKRDELEKLGLSKEAIESVMAMYGKSFEGTKQEIEQLKINLASKDKLVEDANKTIEGFKNVNVEEIKKQADEYKLKFEQSKGEFDKTLNETKKKYALDMELQKYKPKNPTLLKRALEDNKILLDGDKLVGLEEQIKGLKESDPYLFEEETKNTKFGTHNNLPNSSLPDEETQSVRANMGLPPIKK